MNDPLFLREALHEYAGKKEKAGKAKHKKLKNCYTTSEEKVTQNQSSVNPRRNVFSVMAVMIYMIASFTLKLLLKKEVDF